MGEHEAGSSEEKKVSGDTSRFERLHCEEGVPLIHVRGRFISQPVHFHSLTFSSDRT